MRAPIGRLAANASGRQSGFWAALPNSSHRIERTNALSPCVLLLELVDVSLQNA